MGEKKTEEEAQEKREGIFEGKGMLTLVLAALVIVVAFNQFQIATLYSLPLPTKVVAVAASASGGASSGQPAATVSQSAPGTLAAPPDIMPTGTPPVYGAEIGVKYDDLTSGDGGRVDMTINKLAGILGDDPGNVLKGDDLARYVKIGSMIACEYCCGATTMVFPNGQPACGCAHSYAMRGVLGYLVKNHPEMTDDQILEEIGKWKVLFFPGPEQQKAAVLQANGIELSYINIASEKYRGAESGAQISSSGTSGASQVGGC